MAPIRTCVGCRRTAAPDELVRLTVGPDGQARRGQRHPGRGAWLCRDSPPCLDVAITRRAFERALRSEVSEESIRSAIED